MYKTGIGWRRDRLGDLTGSWDDLWNDQAKGKVFVLDDRDEVLGLGALKLGLDLTTGDHGDLARVTDALRSLRPACAASPATATTTSSTATPT